MWHCSPTGTKADRVIKAQKNTNWADTFLREHSIFMAHEQTFSQTNQKAGACTLLLREIVVFKSAKTGC